MAPGFLDRIADTPLEDLRAMRADAEQEETDLSFLRRMLQGRLDILRAEVNRRADGEGATSLIDLLPSILADDGPHAAHGMGHHTAAEPSRVDQHRRHVEAVIADVRMSDPAGLSDESLAKAVEVFEREEAEVSANRHLVQVVMDQCTAEMGRRYREGDADVADLLPSESS